MTVALVTLADGRHEYHHRALASAIQHLPKFDHYVFVNDDEHELGFAGAVQRGFENAAATGADYVFWLECDFTFNRAVPIPLMTAALRAHPHLVQIALLRQPWNEAERRAGGIWQQHPNDYELVHSGFGSWLEHRRFFTTNPCLIPRWVIDRGWPQTEQSEGRFGASLFASDDRLRAAFWGRGEEWVTHVGEYRAGSGY